MKLTFAINVAACLIGMLALRTFAAGPEGVLPSADSAVAGEAARDAAAQAGRTAIAPPTTIEEARSRARLLYETIHGTLQVVHRDFFDEEDAHAIPSASLEDVFHELFQTYDVKVRWLIVETDMVNVDHKAQGDFEENAVKSLAKGEQQVEAIEGGTYRYAGPVRLASQCLKCHVKDRTSTEERTAGLLISMPIAIPNPTAAAAGEPAP